MLEMCTQISRQRRRKLSLAPGWAFLQRLSGCTNLVQVRRGVMVVSGEVNVRVQRRLLASVRAAAMPGGCWYVRGIIRNKFYISIYFSR